MSTVTTSELQQLCDFPQHQRLVRDTLAHALADSAARLRFLGRYASWNGFFGSGVASLAGKIGRARGCFRDPAQPIAALADRSVYVASFFFDAARDEFDDRDTVHRDTHRCLAQSMLKGAIDHARQAQGQAQAIDDAQLAVLLDEPEWLAALNARVASGYGNATPDTLEQMFAAMGYHLGSELLADQEFSIIDRTLRELSPQLVAYLQDARVNIAGQEHRAYQWIAIHSGHGGGAEADHFEWATQGARLAFRFVPEGHHATLREHLHQGFRDFARDHREFFQRVNSDA